ncbi:hypothetical protein N7454_003510 [Penicillium verhagenii]|nr:hypothetical protein N7454_003510 [Penicillium verhagenii]
MDYYYVPPFGPSMKHPDPTTAILEYFGLSCEVDVPVSNQIPSFHRNSSHVSMSNRIPCFHRNPSFDQIQSFDQIPSLDQSQSFDQIPSLDQIQSFDQITSFNQVPALDQTIQTPPPLASPCTPEGIYWTASNDISIPGNFNNVSGDQHAIEIVDLTGDDIEISNNFDLPGQKDAMDIVYLQADNMPNDERSSEAALKKSDVAENALKDFHQTIKTKKMSWLNNSETATSEANRTYQELNKDNTAVFAKVSYAACVDIVGTNDRVRRALGGTFKRAVTATGFFSEAEAIPLFRRDKRGKEICQGSGVKKVKKAKKGKRVGKVKSSPAQKPYNPSNDELARMMEEEFERAVEPSADEYNPTDLELARMMEEELAGQS